MSKLYKMNDEDDQNFCLSLTKQDVITMITLLTAQLADTPAPGNQSGSCPSILFLNAIDSPPKLKRLTFVLEKEKE